MTSERTTSRESAVKVDCSTPSEFSWRLMQQRFSDGSPTTWLIAEGVGVLGHFYNDPILRSC